MTIYSKYEALPEKNASETLTEGCLVLEGGGWRGLYTQGALDALMEADINFRTVIGVSAGAMSSLNYVSGQIGLSARINLKYRHDPNYVGIGAMLRDHGVSGFTYFFEKILPAMGFNWDRFFSPDRRLLVSVTNCRTGMVEYMEKGKCDIKRAVRASATVPYASLPVKIQEVPYLDGGAVEKIPYHWAKEGKQEKIVVIRTRDRGYRKPDKGNHAANALFYHRYPALEDAMNHAGARYNDLLTELLRDEREGRVFVQAPEKPVLVGKFEGDMEKLGALYEEGYSEMKERIPALRDYLGTVTK